MDNVVFLNIIVFLIILIYIVKRYNKYKKIQLIDFLLILFALFFPIGLIRPYMGYKSLIGYDIFKHYSLLEVSSTIVLIFLILFIIGCHFGNSFFKITIGKRERKSEKYTESYLSAFRKITLMSSAFTFILMILFIKSQGSIAEYFQNIESIRQTLSGQMGNYTIIYLNVLLSLYTILIHKKVVLASKIGILISIIFFTAYGFRGPVISVLIITFFTLQKINVLKIRLNFRNVLIGLVVIYLFVYFQDIRSTDSGKEPFLLKLITRFSGYEPVMVIEDKVVQRGMFTFDTLMNNILSFFQLPIPRDMMEDKIKPVSILLTDKLFYDVGDRSFATGGISPTIVGSLIWNFHYLGCIVMLFYGAFSSYIENHFRFENRSFYILINLSISLYLILAIEYPENFLGVLWMLTIGLCVIFTMQMFLRSIIYK
ncbi:oligosaccharide repeat unit polymerase [Elizabethkingia anophelis]|nr:oligosaccharide repeat unit polymerase [Elizabethkingia anophelis]